MEEGKRVLNVLEEYEAESGQKLNKEKTSLFFQQKYKPGCPGPSETIIWGPDYSAS